MSFTFIRTSTGIAVVGEPLYVTAHWTMAHEWREVLTNQELTRIMQNELHRVIGMHVRGVQFDGFEKMQDSANMFERLIIIVEVQCNIDELENALTSLEVALNLLVPLIECKSADDGVAIISRLKRTSRSYEVARLAAQRLEARHEDIIRRLESTFDSVRAAGLAAELSVVDTVAGCLLTSWRGFDNQQ